MIMPGMAVVAVAAQLLLGERSKRAEPEAEPEPGDLEVAVDPAGVLGAGGEEMEVALHRPKGGD